MAQLVGAQLVTYNPNLPVTTSTTAATSGVIVYPQAIDGDGITTANTPAGTCWDGITHFKNVCGINSVSLGSSGAEIPLYDKQGIATWTTLSQSAALQGFVVAPYQCTVAGYWTACTAVATCATVTVQVGSAGATLMTATATALSIGDTVAMTPGTAGGTVVAGGTAISINTSTNGTAYIGMATIVFTRVGI